MFGRIYDTMQIGLVATRLRAVAAETADTARVVNKAVAAMDGTLKGRTAEKLREELHLLQRDVLTVSAGLTAMQQELFALIRRLDNADAMASAEIRRK